MDRTPTPRRFPAPWTVDPIPGGYRVLDATGRALAYVYGCDDTLRRSAADGLDLNEARRIATGIARLPVLLAPSQPPNTDEPHDPATFRDIVEADLRRAARLIIKVQDCLDPQFRIATPEGDYALAVTFPPEPAHRARYLDHLATFMIWKRATAFTTAFELDTPDALCCIGLARW